MQMIIAIKRCPWRIRWGTAVVQALVLSWVVAAGVGCIRPVPPEIVALNGPEYIGQDTVAVFTARINDEATEPVRLLWDFGTGYEDRGLRVEHAFPTEGTYTVRFVAENEAGRAVQSKVVNVREPPAPPRIATVQAQPNPSRVGELVRYETQVQGNPPTTYLWTLGDETETDASEPTHRYAAPGEYRVAVRVENDAGYDERFVTVEVRPNLPAMCTGPVATNPVYFAEHASVLSDTARRSLRENADVFQTCAPLPISIEAHAAPRERNAESLAQDRAAAIASVYRDAGISSDRLRIHSYVIAASASQKTLKNEQRGHAQATSTLLVE